MNYLGVEEEILGCCGLHGLFNMPRTKEEFEEKLRELCDRDFYSLNEDDELINRVGAMIIITTSDYQINANTYLPELGWKKVFSHRNSNSGNIVHLWVMGMDEFNDNWGAY